MTAEINTPERPRTERIVINPAGIVAGNPAFAVLDRSPDGILAGMLGDKFDHYEYEDQTPRVVRVGSYDGLRPLDHHRIYAAYKYQQTDAGRNWVAEGIDVTRKYATPGKRWIEGAQYRKLVNKPEIAHAGFVCDRMVMHLLRDWSDMSGGDVPTTALAALVFLSFSPLQDVPLKKLPKELAKISSGMPAGLSKQGEDLSRGLLQMATEIKEEGGMAYSDLGHPALGLLVSTLDQHTVEDQVQGFFSFGPLDKKVRAGGVPTRDVDERKEELTRLIIAVMEEQRSVQDSRALYQALMDPDLPYAPLLPVLTPSERTLAARYYEAKQPKNPLFTRSAKTNRTGSSGFRSNFPKREVPARKTTGSEDVGDRELRDESARRSIPVVAPDADSGADVTSQAAVGGVPVESDDVRTFPTDAAKMSKKPQVVAPDADSGADVTSQAAVGGAPVESDDVQTFPTNAAKMSKKPQVVVAFGEKRDGEHYVADLLHAARAFTDAAEKIDPDELSPETVTELSGVRKALKRLLREEGNGKTVEAPTSGYPVDWEMVAFDPDKDGNDVRWFTDKTRNGREIRDSERHTMTLIMDQAARKVFGDTWNQIRETLHDGEGRTGLDVIDATISRQFLELAARCRWDKLVPEFIVLSADHLRRSIRNSEEGLKVNMYMDGAFTQYKREHLLQKSEAYLDLLSYLLYAPPSIILDTPYREGIQYVNMRLSNMGVVRSRIDALSGSIGSDSPESAFNEFMSRQ